MHGTSRKWVNLEASATGSKTPYAAMPDWGLASPSLKPRKLWKHCQEFAWNMGALLGGSGDKTGVAASRATRSCTPQMVLAKSHRDRTLIPEDSRQYDGNARTL